MTKVFLREKKIKHGKKSLYLDYYPPIMNPETKKPTRREHLRLYIFDRPKIDTEREHNKETKMLAESIRSQRQLDVQSGYYGFLATRNRKKSFISFFESFAKTKKNSSKSNFESYLSILKHLKAFAGEDCTFGSVDSSLCRNFREFLLDKENLSTNTASAYFDKFKYVVREGYKRKLFRENPAENIRSIKQEDVKREFLTFDELKSLAETPFCYEDLRRACLFSALTGLRYSDIEKLVWKEIRHSEEQGYFVRFKQKKTKDNETLPLSDEAVSLLGARCEDPQRVFSALNYHQTRYISDWTSKVGISRKITFHAFRHTFATLQLTLGTDIYTVSKLLGHKNLQTTQIYARVVDEKKTRSRESNFIGWKRFNMTDRQDLLKRYKNERSESWRDLKSKLAEMSESDLRDYILKPIQSVTKEYSGMTLAEVEASHYNQEFDFNEVGKFIEDLDVLEKITFLIEIKARFDRKSASMQKCEKHLHDGVIRFGEDCKIQIDALKEIYTIQNVSITSPEQNEKARDPNLTQDRALLFFNYLFNFLKADCTQATKAEIISFLTSYKKGRIEKRFSEMVKDHSSSPEKENKDMKTARIYLAKLGIPDLTKMIDNDLNF